MSRTVARIVLNSKNLLSYTMVSNTTTSELLITNNSQLATFDLPRLRSVQQQLTITNNAALRTLSLPSLVSVDGPFAHGVRINCANSELPAATYHRH